MTMEPLMHVNVCGANRDGLKFYEFSCWELRESPQGVDFTSGGSGEIALEKNRPPTSTMTNNLGS
jgi:hypothetical protein